MWKCVLSAGPLAALAAVLVAGSSAMAQSPVCVPGNPLYDRGDYRCFSHRPRPTRARPTVRARVLVARYLSGGPLSGYPRDQLEDWFHGVGASLGDNLPSLVDERGGLHTPDIRLSVVFLASGLVGRVRVISMHADPLDRAIARALQEGVSQASPTSSDGSEVEAIVSFRPTLRYTHWRPRVEPPCCVEEDD